MSDRSNSDVSRRRFLQSAAAVGAGAGLVGEGDSAQAAEKAKLPTSVLGQTKLKVTKVSYGSLHTSGGRGGKVLELTVKDAGINMVHSSNTYKNGNAIKAMGKVFGENTGMRDKLVLCLKGKGEIRQLEKQLDGMLKTLHTDHADVYLPTLHEPDKARLDGIMKLQDDLKKKGKIRFPGFVCHGALNKVFEMVLAEAPKYFGAALLSTQMILAAKKGDAGAKRYVANLAKLKKNGLGIISMKSKAREAMAKGAETFQAHCKTLLDGGVDTVLFTFSAIQQVDNVKQVDLTKTAMAPWEKKLADDFHRTCVSACRMCGACTDACPRGLPVNDLMRIRMYHDVNHDLDYACDTYRDLPVDLAAKASRCGSCTACKDVCPVGEASADRVRYVTSLFS